MNFWYNFLEKIRVGKYEWKIPFGKPVELYRCQSDRRLSTLKMLNKGFCAGHRLNQPAYPTLLELILLWTRLMR